MKTSVTTILCLIAVAVLSDEAFAQDALKKAGNGVEVDISRPYYDSDPTVIQEKLKVVEFRGGFGSFEGGKNYAKVFGREAFTHAVKDAEKSMEQALGLDKAEALEILRESDHLNVLKEFNGGFYRFLDGIAAESNLPVEDVVLALNDGVFFAVGVQATRDKVLEKLGFIRKGCTVAGFDNGILGQNNDNPVKYSGKTVLVKSTDDKIMLLTMGSPLVMLMGMSENLAVVVNTVDAFFFGHSIRDGGLPDAALVMNALLHFKSVDEVVANYKDVKENVAIAQTFADKSGGLATIEFNAKQFVGNIVFRPKSGEHFIAHTNHPKFQEQYLIDTWFDGDKGKANRMLARTIWRLENAQNFLATSADKKPEELKTLFRSHPVLFAASDGLDFRTTVSVIWDIRKQTAYIAPDRPDLVEYQRVTWSAE